MAKNHLGFIGLGVMGQNLALNTASKGFTVAGYEADAAKARGIAEGAAGKQIAVALRIRRLARSSAPHLGDGSGRKDR